MQQFSFRFVAVAFTTTLIAMTSGQTIHGQLEEDQSVKQDIAETIIAEREALMQRSYDPAYRQRLKSKLIALSLEQLYATPSDGPLAIGDTDQDLVFTPVPPCRIADTRFGGGTMGGDTQRSFFVAGDGTLGEDFVGQGGNATGCAIPFGTATAVVINFVAVTPAGVGNLRAFPWVPDAIPVAPLAAVMNYVPFVFALANGLTVPICDNSVIGCGLDLILQADAFAVDVVMDVYGYFGPPAP